MIEDKFHKESYISFSPAKQRKTKGGYKHNRNTKCDLNEKLVNF